MKKKEINVNKSKYRDSNILEQTARFKILGSNYLFPWEKKNRGFALGKERWRRSRDQGFRQRKLFFSEL